MITIIVELKSFSLVLLILIESIGMITIVESTASIVVLITIESIS